MTDGQQQPPLDRFGSLLMAEVRDRLGDADWRGADPHLQALTTGMTPDEVSGLTLRVVDQCLFTMLFLFEEHAGELALTVDGIDLEATSDGLAGELFGRRGWIARFSRHGSSSIDPAEPEM